MKILHLSFSPRGQFAESYRLSRKIVELLRRQAPTATVVDRPIGQQTVAHIDANYANGQNSATAEVTQDGSMSRSEELIQELEGSDVVVIGTPMHNLSVPSALKAWIDHVVRARRTFDIGPAGKLGLLRDRPVFIAVASGGVFSGERARQPDFLTPYLRVVLGTIGLKDLRFFTVEGTGHGPDAVAAARAATDLSLLVHFESSSIVR
jgi:FMN-dependent NADH-azoreductase